ncbi:MAG: FkbM family methyltransferase [Acidobacteria bacterium]|nr:FkbM family methyltransferase [Acidobacteriota bacterium]
MQLQTRLKNSVRLLQRSRFHYYRMANLQAPFWLAVNGQTCRIAAGENPGASSCYAEVVIEDCYDIFAYAKRAKPKVIVDIGANLGVFSKLCSLLFPEADIYAYEPNPTALEWLNKNAEGTRIQVFSGAVGQNSGVVNLDTACDSTIGRVTEDGDLRVQCLAAAEVAAGRPIDFLKMDCEGSEWSILQDPTLLERTQECGLEYHLHDGHTLAELQGLVEQAGHRVQGVANIKEEGKYGVLRSMRQSSAARLA